MTHLIDSYTGAIHLERGLTLLPGQSPDELVRLVGAQPSGSIGSKIWFNDVRMETEHGAFNMALFFQKDALYMFQASILSGYGPAGALIKGRHDKMLTEMLGRAHGDRPIVRGLIKKIMFRSHNQSWHETAQELYWNFGWGTVTSGVDPRDGGAVFAVEWKKR